MNDEEVIDPKKNVFIPLSRKVNLGYLIYHSLNLCMNNSHWRSFIGLTTDTFYIPDNLVGWKILTYWNYHHNIRIMEVCGWEKCLSFLSLTYYQTKYDNPTMNIASLACLGTYMD